MLNVENTCKAVRHFTFEGVNDPRNIVVFFRHGYNEERQIVPFEKEKLTATKDHRTAKKHMTQTETEIEQFVDNKGDLIKICLLS